MNANDLIQRIISTDARATDEDVKTALSMLSQEEKEKFHAFVLSQTATDAMNEKITAFCKESSMCVKDFKNVSTSDPDAVKAFFNTYKSFASRFPIQFKYVLNGMFHQKVFSEWIRKYISSIQMAHASSEHVESWIEMNADFAVMTFIHMNPRINRERELQSVRNAFIQTLRDEHKELMEVVRTVEAEEKKRKEELKAKILEEMEKYSELRSNVEETPFLR
jgi:hypothetical protein